MFGLETKSSGETIPNENSTQDDFKILIFLVGRKPVPSLCSPELNATCVLQIWIAVVVPVPSVLFMPSAGAIYNLWHNTNKLLFMKQFNSSAQGTNREGILRVKKALCFYTAVALKIYINNLGIKLFSWCQPMSFSPFIVQPSPWGECPFSWVQSHFFVAITVQTLSGSLSNDISEGQTPLQNPCSHLHALSSSHQMYSGQRSLELWVR